MRFSNFCATVVATLAACQGASAQWEGGPGGPPESEIWSSTLTTYYSTRTVMRVVETVYSTKNSSSTAWAAAATTTTGSVASAYTPVVVNGTTALGTGAGHTGTAASHTGASPSASTVAASTGAASKYRVELGLAAVAGLAGLLAL